MDHHSDGPASVSVLITRSDRRNSSVDTESGPRKLRIGAGCARWQVRIISRLILLDKLRYMKKAPFFSSTRQGSRPGAGPD